MEEANLFKQLSKYSHIYPVLLKSSFPVNVQSFLHMCISLLPGKNTERNPYYPDVNLPLQPILFSTSKNDIDHYRTAKQEDM